MRAWGRAPRFRRRRGERNRAQQRCEHGHRPEQPRAREQERNRGGGGRAATARCPGGRPRARRARRTRRSPRASQPMRGSTAVAAAAIAGGGERREGGIGAEALERREHEAARGEAREGALEQPAPVGGRPRAAPPGGPAGRRATGATGTARRRDTLASPTRLSVAGSTRPPSSVSSASAACSSARSREGAGRSAGSISSASSTASQSSSGRSRRRAASEGSGRPRRRAVAAGPPARTGFVPVQAS